MTDKSEVHAAETRLILSSLQETLERSASEITAQAASKGTLQSGGTIKKLVRTLIEQLEENSLALISAHSKAGFDNPKDVAQQLRWKLEPIAYDFLEKRKKTLRNLEKVFDAITPDLYKFLDSLHDRAIVAMSEYARPTDQVIAMLSPHKLPVGWERVDRALQKARTQLSNAKDEEDFQNVGLLCREVLISTAQAAYDPTVHKSADGVVPSDTDAKRQLDAFFGTELKGKSNESMRKHARSAIALADELVHKRTANLFAGSLCFEATSSVVNLVAIVSVNR